MDARLAVFAVVGALLAPPAPAAQDAAESPAGTPAEPPVPTARPAARERSIYVDPTDGMFDVTAWLLQARGFFPVPVVITEPALGGFGLGAGLVFLHGTPAQVKDPWHTDMKGQRVLPPSVSVVFGGYTANDSWFAGGGHFGSYYEDRVRYKGAAGYANVNLDYYVGGTGFAYQIEGAFLFQNLMFRLQETGFFVGPRYTLFTNDVTLREDGSGIPGADLDSTTAALGIEGGYDTRDSIFTPNKGVNATVYVNRFDEAFGSDFDYWNARVDLQTWHPLREDLVLGVRALGETVGGGAPFYAQPGVILRGVPRQRYQGDEMFTLDTELRWDFTKRWSAVGFVGVGGANSDSPLRPDYSDVVAGGAGFRYLVGRPISARAGVDVGVGPEGPAVYIQFGTGW